MNKGFKVLGVNGKLQYPVRKTPQTAKTMGAAPFNFFVERGG
jgi:hypothetical protein